MVALRRKFPFGTKSETLERLAPVLTKSRVPEFVHFSVADWRCGTRDGLYAAIAEKLPSGPLIVRSSAGSEDGELIALAGAFLSVPNVLLDDRAEFDRAVEAVIARYRKHDGIEQAEEDASNQVLVQRMVTDVSVSGVVFTQDLNTGAPYYVINYDDETGRTETVTAGNGYINRTLYVLRDAWTQLSSPRFLKIIEAIEEIETVVGDTCLDIEFALDSALNVHLLQVRRITTQPNWNRGDSLKIRDALVRLREALSERYGHERDSRDDMGGAILGNMPDWNPAEMIGTTPRPLAFSLYRHLITDRSWRVARRQMGYRESRGMPLMISLAGQPYIDVRESLRSFLPADLDEAIGEKLVSAWLTRLRDNHHLHDKIEFDVAVTAYAPDFDLRIESQFPDALSSPEKETFCAALRRTTNALLTGRIAGIDAQLDRISTLHRHRQAVAQSETAPHVDMVLTLLEDTIKYGTIPFSILARHGFIAHSYLKALEARGVLTAEEASQFQRSVPTVATEFIRDLNRHTGGELSESEFLERYGHLRPGTYDILSQRYDRRLKGIASFAPDRPPPEEAHSFALSEPRMREIDALLAEEGIEVGTVALFDYCRAAIQGREYAKFVFTHNISDALEIIAALGERYGLSREELSYVSISDFLNAFIEPSGRSVESFLRDTSQRGRNAHSVTNAIRLPFLVTSLSDLVIVPLAVEHPNFVTRKKVDGEVILCDETNLDPRAIDGKIVVIENADPGYDWIFTRPILGLVTKYGGANSHMAIRCAEFGLPAAIGCGEQLFERIVGSGMIDLNCAEGRIIVGWESP